MENLRYSLVEKQFVSCIIHAFHIDGEIGRSTYICMYTYIWRRQWHPTPVLLPGKSHGRRSLVGCSPWGREESTWVSDFTFTFHFHALEKEMATYSSVLAWWIPGTGEPGGLLSLGSHRVRHDWSSSSMQTYVGLFKRNSYMQSKA